MCATTKNKTRFFPSTLKTFLGCALLPVMLFDRRNIASLTLDNVFLFLRRRYKSLQKKKKTTCSRIT
jgi:hypothetical protein